MTFGTKLAVAKFNELLPQLPNMAANKFRRAVLEHVQAQTGCSMPVASSHYQRAFMQALREDPSAVEKLMPPVIERVK